MRKFNLGNSDDISALRQDIADITKRFPAFMGFLEDYCGFNVPVLSSDPNTIAYAGGKRDVVLTIKTIARDDIKAEDIAAFFRNKGVKYNG